ncbi:7700_t:CDS:2, partial [Diversispora eburnea]
MSFSNKDLTRIAEDRKIQKFHYNNFEDIEAIARGGFGAVNNLDWKTKIKMAQDITNGLCYMHKANIVRDLHSKNVLVHEAGGIYAYSDPGYIRNYIMYKRSKASDIYSLGVLFWELSSGRPPFNNKDDFEILEMVKSDNPKQRPTIENICDSLENIRFENIYHNSNKNNQYIQVEVYANNQLNKFKPMKSYNRDSISIISIESNNKFSFGTSISLENLEIAVIGNSGESYDQEWLNNELKKIYGHDVFENLEEIDCWKQDPDQRPVIEKVIQDLEHVKTIVESIGSI